MFERFDVSPVSRLRPRPLRRNRFVLDVHLGKLSRLLRLAGFDCRYQPDLTDLEIIASSSDEKRTILSRDRDLLKHGRVTHGYWVRSTDPPAQFREIIDAFDLRRSFQPFTRCMVCNGHLRLADESAVLDHIPFAVLVAYDEFWQCESCKKIYWKGSHYTQLARLIETI